MLFDFNNPFASKAFRNDSLPLGYFNNSFNLYHNKNMKALIRVKERMMI
jgi:hypothetical protein